MCIMIVSVHSGENSKLDFTPAMKPCCVECKRRNSVASEIERKTINEYILRNRKSFVHSIETSQSKFDLIVWMKKIWIRKKC